MRTLRSLALTALLLATPAAFADGFLKAKPKADDLLPVDQAFALQGASVDGKDISLKWAIAPGYYLYSHMMKFSVDAPAGATLGPVKLPKGESKHDEDFGDVITFRGPLEARFPLAKGAAVPRTLRVRYQGCADIGVCYPPQTKLVVVAASAAH